MFDHYGGGGGEGSKNFLIGGSNFDLKKKTHLFNLEPKYAKNIPGQVNFKWSN